VKLSIVTQKVVEVNVTKSNKANDKLTLDGNKFETLIARSAKIDVLWRQCVYFVEFGPIAMCAC